MNEINPYLLIESNDALRDNSKRAKTLLNTFIILIIITILGLVVSFNELRLLQNIKNDDYISEEEANFSDTLQSVFGFVQFGIYIISIVFFLNWFRRAYGNLHRLGVMGLRYKENRAVWNWFIPIICLFAPAQIMSEIWKVTQLQIKRFNPGYVIRNGTPLIGIWWTLYIIDGIIGRYLLKSSLRQNTIEDLIESSQMMIVSDFLFLLEALFVIILVNKISKMESILAKELHKVSI